MEGEPNDQLIVNSADNCFRIKGINISTTILVVGQDGTICQGKHYAMIRELQLPRRAEV